jgi:hypothetical protein
MSTNKTTTYSRRPTKVVVLNQTFKVEWLATLESHGCVDLNKCVIQIDKGYPKETMVDTLLHELIHCVNHVMDVNDKTTEEQSTTRLATGLCTVWKHNPKVFEWIHKQLT